MGAEDRNTILSNLKSITYELGCGRTLWDWLLETYKEIYKAVFEISDYSALPFDRITHGEIDALNELRSCVEADRKAIATLKDAGLGSIRQRIIELRDKVMNKPTQQYIQHPEYRLNPYLAR